MSGKNKNYNKLIFLTTLSVYLGFVLVGGVPQVLTYAALTKNFDIQNEIEFKDDLDNKPDNEELENLTKDDFPALLAQLLTEIKIDANQGKLSFPLQSEFYIDANFRRSENSSISGLSSTISNQHLNLIVQNAINQKFGQKALELADFDQGDKKVQIGLESNTKDLELKISFSKLHAQEFADSLKKEYSINAVSTESDSIKQIYDGTIVTAQNQYVTIVTRLPRAGLDSLIK